MANSTLQNLKDSAFVRTDPVLAVRIGRYLLHLPDSACNVYDPSSGELDLLYACAHVSAARLFGTEISAERAGVSRRRWSHATILTSAFEAVSVPAGCMDLVLTNPPYFLQNGKRAEYRFVVDAGESLKAGGIMVAIIPARSAWDGTMVNHWLRWYDQIGVWKFPNRTSKDQEGAFDDYTQIVVIGVRRGEPQIPSADEKKRLVGYQWRNPEKAGQSGWKHGTPPPDIPTGPVEGAYRVPSSREIPRLVVRNADEATLLYALDKSGAHLAPTWQQVTEWSEEGYLDAPAMPFTGEAHIAVEVMVGGLDGNLVYGPGVDEDAEPHIFTAFVGQEWVNMPVEDELVEKLREQGCVRVEMRQLMDKPILGVLNLRTGSTRYYQSEEVFTFLQPWLPTLASRVIEQRKPLYRLDPADWEIGLVSQLGIDKRLPNATYPGLAVAQMHRVFAMCRAMDVRGRTAIQGEPGTGKTRMATATAARQAYRQTRTGRLIAPEDAGPSALPVLITTPLKVTKEYGKEILAAFPRAEVVHIETHRDIGRWLGQCARSSAPVVFGIFSHSTTRAFGREWQPAVHEKQVIKRVPDRDPPDDLLDELEAVYDRNSRGQKLVGYRFRGTDRLLTKTVTVTYYFCWECDGMVSAVPGKANQPDEEEKNKKKGKLGSVKASKEREEDGGGEEKKEDEDKKEPVTSKTWFTIKRRWCTCAASKRNQERLEEGKPPLKAALWTDERLAATNRKYPSLSFGEWSAAMASLRREAEHQAAHASVRELAEQVRRNDALLARLAETALTGPETASAVLELVARTDGSVSPLQLRVEHAVKELGALLLSAAMCDTVFLQGQVRAALDDEALFDRLMQAALRHTNATEACRQLTDCQQGLGQLQAQLVERISAAIHGEQSIVYLGLQGEQTLATRLLETAQEADRELVSLAAEVQQGREHLLEMVVELAQQDASLFQEVIAATLQPTTPLAHLLVTLARRDIASLK